MKISLLLLALLPQLGHSVASSHTDATNSTATVGCDKGKAAVDATHLSKHPTTGSLEKGNITVTLNKVPMDSTNSTILAVNQKYTLEVSSPAEFRGVLVRVEGKNNFQFLPGKNTKDAVVCTAKHISGITESSNKPVKVASGHLTFTGAQIAQIDVTVIVSNDKKEGSEYYFTSFTDVRVEEDSDTPSAAPKESSDLATATTGCAKGEAAVDATHLYKHPTMGSLEEGNIVVELGKIALEPEDETVFAVGQKYELAVQSSSGFRSVLVRVEGKDFTLMPDKTTTNATACTGQHIAGIVESSNGLKTVASGHIQFLSPQNVQIDVTVVVSNDKKYGSEYYFTSFSKLRAEEDSATAAAQMESMETSKSGAGTAIIVITCLVIVIVALCWFYMARKKKQNTQETIFLPSAEHQTIT